MKRQSKRLLLFCICMVSVLASSHGEENVLPAITFSSQVTESPVIGGISGSNISMALSFLAPLGSAYSVDCKFFQASNDLAAPLPGGGQIVPELDFSDRTFRRIEVAVPMPEVERETLLVARFTMKSKPDAKEVAFTNVSIRLIPGPESALNPITRLKKLPDGSLLVTGESPRIRAFFDKTKIPYVDGVIPSQEISSVVLSEGNEMPVNIPSGLPVLLFCKSDRLLPGVYMSANSRPPGIKVTLPILDRISSDILDQVAFADLIFSALPTPPKTEP